jgi:hypothetical protein
MNQDTLWIPATILGILYPCFVGYLVYSVRLLPERPAVHFSLRGNANGWMNRIGYLLLMFVLGTGLAFFQVVPYAVAKTGPNRLHIPRAEYWLAPEHASETTVYLIGHSLWFACLVLGFIGALHFLIVRANQKVVPRISMILLLVVVATFVGGVITWEKNLERHFLHYSSEKGSLLTTATIPLRRDYSAANRVDFR